MRLEIRRARQMKRERGGAFRRSLSLHSDYSPDQVQTITPVELSQFLADCECVAVAVQPCGGPATRTAVMVTFCEGVKPCIGVVIVAVPAKYAPLLSAAYCSS